MDFVEFVLDQQSKNGVQTLNPKPFRTPLFGPHFCFPGMKMSRFL